MWEVCQERPCLIRFRRIKNVFVIVQGCCEYNLDTLLSQHFIKTMKILKVDCGKYGEWRWINVKDMDWLKTNICFIEEES